MRKDFLFSIVTGILLSLAFPPFRIGIAAYWGLVPFFYLLRKKEASEAFWWGLLTGMFIALSSLNVTIFSTLRGLGAALFINSSSLALYSMTHAWLMKRRGNKFIATVPLLWTVLEYFKAKLFGGGVSWTNLGYTHPQFLHLLKNEISLNLFGICFWLVLINVLIFSILTDLGNKRKAILLIASIILLLLLPWYLEKRSTPAPRDFDDRLAVAFIC